MKVIGTTGPKLIVEATAEELAFCAGYESHYAAKKARDDFTDSDSRNHYMGSIRVGTQFDVTAALKYLQALRENEAKCRSSAAFLRGMADMIDGALPTTIVPPKDDAKDQVGGASDGGGA